MDSDPVQPSTSSSSLADISIISHEEGPTPGDTQRPEEENDDLEIQLEKIQRALDLNQKLIERFKAKQQELIEKRDELELEAELNKFGYEDDDIAEEGAAHQPGPSTRKSAKTKISLLPFFRPYLRDSSGLSAPPIFSTEELDFDPSFIHKIQSPKPVREWTEKEIATIRAEVRSQYLSEYSREKIQKMERLLEDAPPGVRSPELVEEINRINSELALAKSRCLEPPERWWPHIDWLVIAKQLPPDRSGDDCELVYNNRLHPSINVSPKWTQDEDKRLETLAKEHHEDWDAVARELGTGRLAWQCASRYQSELNPAMRKKGRIEGEEAEEILRIIHQFTESTGVNWCNVQCLVEGRSGAQLRHFHDKITRPTITRKWSKLEDRLLIIAQRLYKNRWKQIAQFFPSRNNRQLRERFHGQLIKERKWGHWTEPEDELILEMATKYHRPGIGMTTPGAEPIINFPEIQRLYFPNRNVHQVYRRYNYLRSILPPESVRLLENAAAGTAASGDADVEALKLQMHKVTRKRMRSRRAGRTLTNLPDEPDKLRQILLEGRRTLLKQAAARDANEAVEDDDQEEEDDEEDEERDDEDAFRREDQFAVVPLLQIGKKRRKRAGAKPNPIVQRFQAASDEEALAVAQYDHLLASFSHLFHDCRLSIKGVELTGLDLNANLLISIVLLECLDPAVERNLMTPINYDFGLSREVKSLHDPDYPELIQSAASCSLDTFRAFMSATSVLINESHWLGSTAPKSLVTPNYWTMFGFSMLQFMSKGLLFQIAESDPQFVEDFNVEQVTEEQDYQDLRSIFFSLFGWPALLNRPDFGGDPGVVQTILRPQRSPPQVLTTCIEEVREGEEEAKPAKKKAGRPVKRRNFPIPVDEFVRFRSYQAAVLLATMSYDTMRLLKQRIFPPGGEESEHWPTEPRDLLLDRVRLYLSTVWKSVESSLEQRKKQNQARPPKSKKRSIKASESDAAAVTPKPKRITTPVAVVSAETPETRRSTRIQASRAANPVGPSYKEMLGGKARKSSTVVRPNKSKSTVINTEEPIPGTSGESAAVQLD